MQLAFEALERRDLMTCLVKAVVDSSEVGIVFSANDFSGGVFHSASHYRVTNADGSPVAISSVEEFGGGNMFASVIVHFQNAVSDPSRLQVQTDLQDCLTGWHDVSLTVADPHPIDPVALARTVLAETPWNPQDNHSEFNARIGSQILNAYPTESPEALTDYYSTYTYAPPYGPIVVDSEMTSAGLQITVRQWTAFGGVEAIRPQLPLSDNPIIGMHVNTYNPQMGGDLIQTFVLPYTTTINGTAGNDTFEFIAVTSILIVNGVSQQIAGNVTIVGGGGNDTAILYPGSNATLTFDTATGSATCGYLQLSGFTNVQAYGRGTASFTGTGNDIFITSPMGSQFLSNGYNFSAWGFRHNEATGGGIARFYGTIGGTGETFNASLVDAVYQGMNFDRRAVGFKHIEDYAPHSSAVLTGSSGTDRAVTSALGAQIFGSDYEFSAWGCDVILNGNGGNDFVDFYGGSHQMANGFTTRIDRR